MKKLILLVIFIATSTFAINTLANTPQNTPKVGEVLTITTPKHTAFRYVKFPKLNFLVKQGNRASYKSAYNTDVVITKVETTNNNIKVTLARKDGKAFFKGTATVTAYYQKAIAAGELVK